MRFGHLSRLFPAFQNPNYRIYFSGQVISLVGTWLQIVAQGWLVLQLTNSAFQIGLVGVAATLPAMVLTPFGGVLVDRLDKKKILICTQSASMVLALALGFLTIWGHITVWQVGILAFLLGIVSAFDVPARQSFVVELVKREDLSSAIGLNSAVFNGARVIGPTIAGFLIAWFGVGGAFIANGISYIAAIGALFYMNIERVIHDNHPHPIRALQEGIKYALAHPMIRTLLLFTASLSIFGWSYSTMMPLIARDVFGLDASGLGWFYAFTGLGAMTAAFSMSAIAKKFSPFIAIMVGNLVFVTTLVLFSFTTSFWMAGICLIFLGFGLMLQSSTANSAVQHAVEDRLRGRVMSLYVLMFMGMFPVGNFQIGTLAEKVGVMPALRFEAGALFLAGILLWTVRAKLSDER